jgi:hypothetical protein
MKFQCVLLFNPRNALESPSFRVDLSAHSLEKSADKSLSSANTSPKRSIVEIAEWTRCKELEKTSNLLSPPSQFAKDGIRSATGIAAARGTLRAKLPPKESVPTSGNEYQMQPENTWSIDLFVCFS